MICSIYKGYNKQGSYLYIKKNSGAKDDFSCLPEALVRMLGKLDLAMRLEINKTTKLAQASGASVLNEINENGYYLQLTDIYNEQN